MVGSMLSAAGGDEKGVGLGVVSGGAMREMERRVDGEESDL